MRPHDNHDEHQKTSQLVSRASESIGGESMAISGDLKLFPSFSPHSLHSWRPSVSRSKIPFGQLPFRGSYDFTHKSSPIRAQCFWNKGDNLSHTTTNNDAEGFLLNSISKSFTERLSLARRILFPSTTRNKNSNAQIAKQRLKMILYSDRCEVSDEAKQKIVSSIVEALSDFVEIESQDKVQLNVSTDPGLGTVYSVAVPVRRVKREYQETEEDYRGKITGIEYKDKGEGSGTVDVRFNFFVPEDK
ncbi:uncharacterized protein A4U43_C08F13920 [Asparagus officinalis]|uniref:cell division topological specificity factor homolog, chloroplastic n=1 Tax=Asparagus officinalis TaxID=4686 RepID=UPI00098DEB98|nr:cell division topological specificity factor homolog, chloroplastic [Asparagus officinalis]ONK60075.1 uncharacterized protein A4U43_C08F13920 [Asparagus officinalis]